MLGGGKNYFQNSNWFISCMCTDIFMSKKRASKSNIQGLLHSNLMGLKHGEWQEMWKHSFFLANVTQHQNILNSVQRFELFLCMSKQGGKDDSDSSSNIYRLWYDESFLGIMNIYSLQLKNGFMSWVTCWVLSSTCRSLNSSWNFLLT